MKHIFLIRHADQLRVSNNLENSQVENEKIILSAKGEKQAQEISQLKELKNNIDEIFSSSYSRAISTAKYKATT
jgi:broad specificity phosphatase PhoE